MSTKREINVKTKNNGKNRPKRAINPVSEGLKELEKTDSKSSDPKTILNG